MTAIEDIKYLQQQGRLVMDMNTRAILELYEAVERIENALNLKADSDEPVHVPESQ